MVPSSRSTKLVSRFESITRRVCTVNEIGFLLRKGTSLLYRPGLLTGGSIEHECCPERSIGYFLEVLVCLAPFCKKPFDVHLSGVTHHPLDPSVSWY